MRPEVQPGLQGNLIVQAFAASAAGGGRSAAPANRRRTALGILPAIPL